MGLGIETEHKRDPFDEFLDTLKEPRQVMSVEDQDVLPDEPVTTDFELEGPERDDDTPQDQKKRYNLSLIPAETLVNCVDIAFTQVNGLIAKQKVEGATPDEKDSLIQAAASYMKEKDIDISPGAMLVVMVLVIYGPKVYQAIELRKANEEKELLQKQLEEERKKVEMLEAANKIKNDGK